MIKYETLQEARDAGVAPWDLMVERITDFHVAVFEDRYPVAPGHLLFVPQYNTDAVISDCFETAMREGRRMVAAGECDAFNIGINCGEAAGQTVMYPHVHLIPRRHGDCADPIGGVRGVISGQANYKADGYQLPA
jgi:diadenosine tetraphosphate (Ap4A) HIT family hydrolase